MDLDRHLQVLWQRRAIIIGGLLLGLVTALLAAYKPTAGALERRGSEQWTSSSMVFVTQKGFPWGRATIPMPAELGGEPAPETEGPPTSDDAGGIPLDPARLTNLAQVYTVMATSDEVRSKLPRHLSGGQIEAITIDPTGQGNQLVPVFQLTTTAGSASAARELNRETVAALKRTVVQEQSSNRIPEADRVQLEVLQDAGAPLLEAGRSWVASILAFMLCIGGAIALAHLVENLSMARTRKPAWGSAGANDLDREFELITDDLSYGDAAPEPPGSGVDTAHLSRIGAYRDRLRDR